jgi:hypothetical protein
MPGLRESDFEDVVLSELGTMGFTLRSGETLDPDVSGERESYHIASGRSGRSRECRP